MKKVYNLSKVNSTLIAIRHFFLTLVLLLTIVGAVRTQTLISPTGAGGFENGSTFGANGWSVANSGGGPNLWYVGTVPTGFSNRSAFISNDMGASYQYDGSSTSVVHFYRDVTFPAGVPSFTLSFNWKCIGEAGPFDALIVSLAPTSYTPSGSTVSLGTGVLPSPANMLGGISAPQLRGQSVVQTYTYTLLSSDIGNCSSSVTKRLIFTWKNDSSLGTNPPGAVDNISLVGNPISISNGTDRCNDGATIAYTGSPAPGAGQTGTMTLGPTSPNFSQTGPNTANFTMPGTAPGTYTATYHISDVAGCTFSASDQVTIYAAPVVSLNDKVVNCATPGT
ncbi:MAG: hypothetical protein H6576_09345 [Lewinellaceae bacterium]|nr:hypothetical protein [Saprospiraceae bacterium]MCB9343890.1 hypothetical protein [Lewinellaceae bacterium]